MGYDQHRQSGSWGILSCIGAVAVLFVVGLGIIALIGVGVAIWQDFGGVPQVAVVEQEAAEELHDLEDIELDRMVPLQRQDASFADSSDPRLNFELNLDQEGNASVDAEEVGAVVSIRANEQLFAIVVPTRIGEVEVMAVPFVVGQLRNRHAGKRILVGLSFGVH